MSNIHTPICDQLGIKYPIFAFTPSAPVAAAVTRAGGMGVLGCVRFNEAAQLDQVLTWMDENTDGLPYGFDVVMPNKIPQEGSVSDLDKYVPDQHRKFVDDTLVKLGVPPLDHQAGHEGVLGWLHSVAKMHVDTALNHNVKLMANALGSPPADVIDQCHQAGVQVAALAGTARHAKSHVDNGVDIIVSQGWEAGGHTGEVSTMVLTPEVVDAVGPDVPVLAAGGIGSGRQVAAVLALGAQGAWTGSLWLTAKEYDLSIGTGITKAILRATSEDTVRSRVYSGKPARLLKTKWTDAWEAEGAPEPLPMPLQNILVSDAHNRMNSGDNPDTVAMPAGQIVGRTNEVVAVADTMVDLVAEFEASFARLSEITKD